MKPLAEQDHYEVLDVARGATREEIERAYRLAQATYADDSLAGYSVFRRARSTLMRERIELAYRDALRHRGARAPTTRALSRAAPTAARAGVGGGGACAGRCGDLHARPCCRRPPR